MSSIFAPGASALHFPTVSLEGEAQIKVYEACKLLAYSDTAGTPTIGYGTIRYPDGRKVQLGDTCSQEQADYYFRHDLLRFELAVDALTTDQVSQRQFDALVSFTYNEGDGPKGYAGSGLRRLVNLNVDDPAIRGKFMNWHYIKSVPSEGLWNRRWKEADWYFGANTLCPNFPNT